MRNKYRILTLVTLFWGIITIVNAEEAKLYDLINPPQPTESKDKIEVLELFWYTCPHCYGFQTYIDKWLAKKPDDVKFGYLPAVYENGKGVEFAKVFYTAQLLGVLDKLHKSLYEAVHVQKRQLKGEDQIMAFFVEHGVKEEDFQNTYNSFAVDTLLRTAVIMTAKYGVTGVPSLVFEGKYRITTDKVKGYQGMLDLVDQLAVEERQRRSAGAPSSTPIEQTGKEKSETPAAVTEPAAETAK